MNRVYYVNGGNSLEADLIKAFKKTCDKLALKMTEIIEKEGNKYFKGILELPLAVGTVGGAVSRNPIYQTSFNMLGNPSAQELSEILVSVGLAQNFAALRALAI